MTLMTPTTNDNETPRETVGMGIRLTLQQRAALEKIAARQCNTVGGIIRLAVQQMLEQEPQASAARTLVSAARQGRAA